MEDKKDELGINSIEEIIENNEEEIVPVNDLIEEEIIEEKPKILTKKEKRREKVRKALFSKEDIKYRGPLSYRYLRVLGWLSIASAQVALLTSLCSSAFGWNPIGKSGSLIFSLFGYLSTSFFLFASFGMVLSGQKKYSSFLLTYGLGFLAIGLGFIFFYSRYVYDIFKRADVPEELYVNAFKNLIGNRIPINVFSDLFMFVLFHFFINHHPKKILKNNIKLFRSLSILPVLFVVVCYILRILNGFSIINMSIYLYPFLPTKSPFIFALFIIISLWIKNRERWFNKLGATKEEYNKFSLTNRNSLSFSIHISIIIGFIVLAEIILGIFLGIIYLIINPDIDILNVLDIYQIGQSGSLLFAVPFLFLYSYTRTHKDKTIDIIIPIVGVGLIVWTYIEILYQILIHFVS